MDRKRIPEERLHLLADVAEMYYAERLSQQEIAARVGLSRSMISRLLLDASDLGIVEIRIHRPVSTSAALGRELRQCFGLRDARVMVRRGADDAEALPALGRLGAQVLDDVLYDGVVFGLSWGVGVRSVVQAMRHRPLPGARVVQLIGGVGSPNRQLDGTEQCRRAGEALDAHYYYLNAPLIVESTAVADALRADRSIREVLALATQTEVALFSIGSIDPQVSSQIQTGYLSLEEAERLAALGIVGDMCGRYFDIAGHPVPVPWLDPRVIGISWQDLTRFQTCIGIAGGRRKAPAILGALRSGIVHILVTDDEAATEVLRLYGAAPPP